MNTAEITAPESAVPTLLYVEDDVATAQAFETIMVDDGRRLTLITVADGDAALALLAQDRPVPHLIVLDLNLPKMNGFDLYHEIRSRNLSSAPIILFTSARSQADQKKAMDMGFAAFLHKATDFNAFCLAIEQIYGLLVEATAHPGTHYSKE